MTGAGIAEGPNGLILGQIEEGSRRHGGAKRSTSAGIVPNLVVHCANGITDARAAS